MTSVNQEYEASSQRVLERFQQGDIPGATSLHLNEEHPTSHKLEESMRILIATANEDMTRAQVDFQNSRTFFTAMVLAFSGDERHRRALAGIRALVGLHHSRCGRCSARWRRSRQATSTQHVEVPNRDEFGKLAQDLNGTSERLATLFDDQRTLATRLGQTNASLERASEAKSRFLANVSHELRTPMTAILGFTDALLAGVDGPLNEEQKASLGWVQRGGQDLLGLINEILDLSKIEAGKLDDRRRAVRPARAGRVGGGAAPLTGRAEGHPLRLAR